MAMAEREHYGHGGERTLWPWWRENIMAIMEREHYGHDGERTLWP